VVQTRDPVAWSGAREGEPYARLQRNVGIYNIVWAGTGAFAYFIGGAMLERLSLNSIFFVPGAFLLAQLALVHYFVHYLPFYFRLD
jgi:hypothetical protein